MTIPLLSLQGITKRYPGVVANQDVSLTVMPGQAHAVLGENGAGKSTLMKIIYGSVKPDEGQVFFKGQPVNIRNPQEARKLGISMVFQHFSLFDTLSVAQNVWLGLDKSLSLAEVTQRIRDKATPVLSNGSPCSLITAMDVRRYIRRMIESELPELPVLSYQELANDITLHPVARVTA